MPALLAGAVVQFAGNRHFAFKAASRSLRRQAVLFALTEAVALTLNAFLYHAVASGFRPKVTEISLPAPPNFPFGDDQDSSTMSFVLILRIIVSPR